MIPGFGYFEVYREGGIIINLSVYSEYPGRGVRITLYCNLKGIEFPLTHNDKRFIFSQPDLEYRYFIDWAFLKECNNRIRDFIIDRTMTESTLKIIDTINRTLASVSAIHRVGKGEE